MLHGIDILRLAVTLLLCGTLSQCRVEPETIDATDIKAQNGAGESAQSETSGPEAASPPGQVAGAFLSMCRIDAEKLGYNSDHYHIFCEAKGNNSTDDVTFMYIRNDNEQEMFEAEIRKKPDTDFKGWAIAIEAHSTDQQLKIMIQASDQSSNNENFDLVAVIDEGEMRTYRENSGANLRLK